MAGLRRLLLILGAAGILLAGGIGWLVSYRGLRPLDAISRRAAAIAAERNFSRRIDFPARRGDEVARLAATIDGLLGRVDETVRAHREFLADTSHELRNPLMAMRTNLELLDRVRDGDAREECIREASQQVDRMSRLVSDLLLLAQVESHLVLEQGPVDLTSAVQQAVNEARTRAPERDITFRPSTPATALADEARVRQILANLLDNAIKHTPAEVPISVGLANVNGEVCLSVEDRGPGISVDALPHIFERGFRASADPAAGESGYGLGLAIVKHLAEAHGGWVEAQSQLGRGTRISVWLKKGQEDNLLALA